MEEEDIQGRGQGVIPIVPRFALLLSVGRKVLACCWSR